MSLRGPHTALILLLPISLLSGCFQVHKQLVLNQMGQRPEFKLCLLNAGIEPLSFEDCLRRSANPESARRCITPEQKPILERCALESDVATKERTHNTSCYPGLFGGVNCTSD